MEHLEVSKFLEMLVVMLLAARLFGSLARAIGQPAVLGEMLVGILLGPSILGWVNPEVETIHLLSELGVIVLLFAIGLETDLKKLIEVGPTSAAVAVVGVALPFMLGYIACKMLGKSDVVSIMAGAALTATSVGITARVLSDLGKLHAAEGQVILGAAVLDDILGLVILAVVIGLGEGGEVSLRGIASTSAAAFGFLTVTLVLGTLMVPRLFRIAARFDLAGSPAILAMILAFGLAWLADRSGSALIVGAFAAGLLVAAIPQSHEIERGIAALGHLFVPLFFVAVGASVDVTSLNPSTSDGREALLIGGALVVAGVFGKWLAGFAPFWFRGSKMLIGAGMIPRGEVGLIFAQKGLEQGVFDAGMFGGVMMMVMVTTMMAPPLLKYLSARDGNGRDRNLDEPGGIDDLVYNA
jgi:Kef-type K+ transport system membrane component KefB